MNTSLPQEHLFLLLSRKGLGEAILGLRLAESLRAEGDAVSYLVHESNVSLLPVGASKIVITSDTAALLPLFLMHKLSSTNLASIVLGDYLTSTLFYETQGLDDKSIREVRVPLIAIDTWNSRVSGDQIDVFENGCRTTRLWPESVRSILPVPFLAPESSSHCYQSLPNPIELTSKIKNHMRQAFGLGSGEKLVLFCTAGWQQSSYASESGVRLSHTVPELIGEYTSRLGRGVHLVHVGPRAYEQMGGIGERYHWLPPLPPDRFDVLLGSVDLFLSANISATTLSKAMVYGVPSLVVENPLSLHDVSQAIEFLDGPPSPYLSGWLERSLPIFPFSLWPLGYHKFLQPLMAGNPYRAALEVHSLLSERAIEARMASLLFDATAREEQLNRQACYLDQVRALPTGAQCVRNLLRG